MKIEKLNNKFGVDCKNLIDKANNRTVEGALACLETFYYAFNNKNLEILKRVWLNHELIQLNNPLGGIIRGIAPITNLYDKIFNGKARVWVEFSDIVVYQSDDTVTFAGRETGEFRINDITIELQIRTTRFLSYSKTERQWFQVHHHGSIDNADLLDRYQRAIKS